MAQSTPDPGGLAGVVVDVMEAMGAFGAGVMVAVENIFPPIPSEVVLPFAGFAASRGDFSLVAALAWTTAGSVFGAIILFAAGRWLGAQRTKRLLTMAPLVNDEDVEKAQAWFARHGPKAVFFGRMVPLIRSFISLPAGTEGMALAPFLLLTTVGSFLWNATFVLIGYQLGEEWESVGPYADTAQKIVIAAILLAVARFVFVRVRRARQAPGH